MVDPAGLNQEQAAAYVGLSVNSFKQHVRPYIKRIDLGRRMVFPRAELDRWLADAATSL